MFMYTTAIRTILAPEEMKSAGRPTGMFGYTASTARTGQEEAGYPTTHFTCTIPVRTVALITAMPLQGTSQNVERSPVATILQEEGITMGLTVEVWEIRGQMQVTTMVTTGVPLEDLILAHRAAMKEMSAWNAHNLAETSPTLQNEQAEIRKTGAI